METFKFCLFQVLAQFTRDVQDFKIVEALRRDEPITSGIRLDPSSRELVYQDFSRRSADVSKYTCHIHFVTFVFVLLSALCEFQMILLTLYLK